MFVCLFFLCCRSRCVCVCRVAINREMFTQREQRNSCNETRREDDAIPIFRRLDTKNKIKRKQKYIKQASQARRGGRTASTKSNLNVLRISSSTSWRLRKISFFIFLALTLASWAHFFGLAQTRINRIVVGVIPGVGFPYCLRHVAVHMEMRFSPSHFECHSVAIHRRGQNENKIANAPPKITEHHINTRSHISVLYHGLVGCLVGSPNGREQSLKWF